MTRPPRSSTLFPYPTLSRSGFRGHDGIATLAEAIRVAGKDEPKAIRDALWKVSLVGVNGPIKFEKDGPAGKESGQSKPRDRKSTRLNSSHSQISYAVFCLKKKKTNINGC